MKKAFAPFLLTFFTLTLGLAGFSAGAAGDEEEEDGKDKPAVKVVKQDDVMATLAAHQADAQFTSRFILTGDEFTALENLLTGLTDTLYQNGYYQTANSMTLGRLSDELSQRLYSVIQYSQDQILQRLDYHPHGAVAQWLDDRGWNPEVLYLVREIGKSPVVDMDALARERGVEPKKYRETPHLIPNSLNAPALAGAGSQLKGEGAEFLRGLAFGLDRQGRPKSYDPVLINLQEHGKNLRYLLATKAVTRPAGGWSRYWDNFSNRAAKYQELAGIIETIEVATHDLQGMLDAVRYKITLATNTYQVYQLNLILNRILKLRTDLVNLSAQFYLTAGLGAMDFGGAYGALRRYAAPMGDHLATIRTTISADIDLIDKILSHDDTEQERYMHDSPFELKFKFDEKNAEHADLLEYWESVRTHQYKVKEIYKTAHWTTTEEDTDSKGNRTKRTVHHNTSSTDWEYATMQTPQVEMDMAGEIGEVRKRLLKASAGQIDSIRAELEALKTRQAKYTETEPAGKHDYSDKYLDRNQTLLKQIDALLQQSYIVEVKNGGTVKDYNRSRRALPKYARQLEDFLTAEDARRGRVRRITGGVVGGVAAAGGIGWAACHFLLNGGGL